MSVQISLFFTSLFVVITLFPQAPPFIIINNTNNQVLSSAFLQQHQLSHGHHTRCLWRQPVSRAFPNVGHALFGVKAGRVGRITAMATYKVKLISHHPRGTSRVSVPRRCLHPWPGRGREHWPSLLLQGWFLLFLCWESCGRECGSVRC